MASAGFFTRLAQLNTDGPNMLPTSEDTTEPVWVCSICDEAHDDEDNARDCCRPSVYERFRCATCRTVYRDEQDADDCHPSAGGNQPMQCPICLARAESFEDAADCCLHTHPTMTAIGRERVAAAVASGAPWPDAIAANESH